MSFDDLPFSAFDLVFVAILIAGLLRGRKNGMSVEFMGLVTWVAIVLGCAVAYAPLGEMFVQQGSVFSLLSCYLLAYVAAAMVIYGLFALFKRILGGKLLGSDIFGRSEYYLGMGSGVVRFTCILLAVLALLNARYFPPTEVRAMQQFQDDVYGSNYFPTLHTVQSIVFEKSLFGRWIKDNLSFLLIKPTVPEVKELHQKEYNLP